LYTAEGDTVTAVYVDSTLPPSYLPANKLDLISTAIIGNTGPPLERVFASSFRIYDIKENLIKNNVILVDQQISLVADIKNQYNKTQNFAYIVQLQDERHTTVSLSWLTGTLEPFQSLTTSQSWIPQKSGKYTGIAFIWESVENPTAMSVPLEIEITVKK
jgi:hypothetical protein